MSDASSPQTERKRRRWLRLCVRLAGLLFAVLLGEILLAVAGQPRLYQPRTSTPQFFMPPQLQRDPLGYINVRSRRIRFVYDGNPRGYFGDQDHVDHDTNAFGFRGPEFSLQTDPEQPLDKPPGVRRVVFLGDSFTFGEGVWFQDTMSEVCAKALGEGHQERAGEATETAFECYNFAVGGHNTVQSLRVLELFGMSAQPDAVVLGYVLNDAEPPLYVPDPATGQLVRRGRPIEEATRPWEPPAGVMFRLRTVQLISKFLVDRERSKATVNFYRSLYTEANPGWSDSQAALQRIAAICNSQQIPCCVVLFPMLHQLDDYPFQDVHQQIQRQVEAAGASFVDLLPEVQGRKAADLWVHPTDPHPNEVVHGIAGRLIAEKLIEAGFPP